MSRALSLAARRAVNAQETGEVFLMLLTIAHAELEQPIRVVNDGRNCTSRGHEFIAFPFEISLPGDLEDTLPTVTLTIDNVDRQIVTTLRGIASPPTVSLEVVLASSPDIVEAGPFDMTLKTATYDALTVSGSLAFEDVLNEPFPYDSYLPSNYPGLF